MVAPDSFHAIRFGRSAARYEAQAGVQARMVGVLLSLLGARPAPASILEFGCGTGLLTRALRTRFPGAQLLATDASSEMLDIARDTIHEAALAGSIRNALPVAFTVQDASGDVPPAEALLHRKSSPSSPDLHPDMVASGALVQWFPDLAKHFRYVGSLIAPGTPYLVSGFDRANFPELNAILSEPPFSYRNYPGHTREYIEAAAESAGWTIASFVGWEEREVLPTARAVLKRIQDLGSVRDPREGGRMNRQNLQHLLEEYTARFSGDGGVRLTWKPWAALLIKA